NPSSYCLLVNSTPIVPSPIHEARESIEERPGNLNKGRIISVVNVPNNSINPKFISKGKNNPANKNIENNECSKQFNNCPPVETPQMASGPISKNVIIPRTAASIREIAQNVFT